MQKKVNFTQVILHKKKVNFTQVKNNIYRKVAPPVPDVSSRPPPPLRI